MKRFNANLIPFPAIEAADNELTYCVRLTERDIQLLLSQTEYLHWAKRYTETSAIAPDELRDTVNEWASQVEARLMTFEEDCPAPIETCCEQFIPEQSWIAFYPNDPFTTPDYVPEGYLLPPFYTNPVLLPFDSRLPTDAILNFASFPLTQTLPELLATGFPRFRVNFEGSGQIEIEMLKVINGGYAIVQLDDNPLTDKVIDCNQFAITDLADYEELIDILLEGKLVQTEIVEFDIDSGGAHHIDVYFLPNIGGDIILGWGGGLRSVEMCNGITAGEDFTMQMRAIEADENCTEIQWRPNSEAAWIPLTQVCNGADGEAAPPLHMGFDAANCTLKYTQGDISSPYVGGDWISVFDWNNADLKECLGLVGSVNISPDDMIDAEACNIAFGMATYLLFDVEELVQFDLDNGPYASKLTFAGALITDGGFWFGSNWNLLPPLMNWANSYTSPSTGMIDELQAPDTLTFVAQAIFCALEVDGGTITLNRDTLNTQLATYDAIIDTNASHAITEWIERAAETRLQNHFNRAAATETGHDCSELDCYTLATCLDYADDMQGGLGAQTRLFSDSFDFVSAMIVKASPVAAGEGIDGGDAIIGSDSNGGQYRGGFFVDLGRECTVNTATVWYRSQFDSNSYPSGVTIDFYDEDQSLLLRRALSPNPDMSTEWRSFTAANSPPTIANVRYVAFYVGSSTFAGASGQMYLANPSVDVV